MHTGKTLFAQIMDLLRKLLDENQLGGDFLADNEFTPSRVDASEFLYKRLMQDLAPELVISRLQSLSVTKARPYAS